MNLNNKVVAVKIENDDKITLKLDNGSVFLMSLDAECCSHSHFEDLSIAEARNFVGRNLKRVAEVCSKSDEGGWFDDESQFASYHALKFTFADGEEVLDWRNESNGYYDGTARCYIITPDGKKSEVDLEFDQ